MKFELFTTPKGNTFKLIYRNQKFEIGYNVFMHNHYAPILTSENIELFNENYIAMCFCAKMIEPTPEGMDIPKALFNKTPAAEWMQLEPTYAFCTVGMMIDIRLLRDKGSEGVKTMNHLLNSFYNFMFKDLKYKDFEQLQGNEFIKSDVRRSIYEYLGLQNMKKKKVINWDNELTKLMGGQNEEKKVE